MVDTAVETAAYSSDWSRANSPYRSVSDGDNGVVIWTQDSTNDFYLSHTANGGSTWTDVRIDASNARVAYGLWYEKWTPGKTGATVYLWWADAAGNGHDVRFTSFELSGTAPSADPTPVTVVDGASFNANNTKARNNLAGCLTVGGVLLLVWKGDGDEHGLVYSTDDGANWADAGVDSYEVDTADHAIIAPGDDSSNTNDCALFYFDDNGGSGSGGWTVKRVNYNAGSTTITNETTIGDASTSVSWATSGFAIDSDGLIYFGWWNAFDSGTGNDDLKLTTVTLDTGDDSITVTTKSSDILTDQTEAAGAALCYDRVNDHLYCAYVRSAASALGTEALGYYRVTTNPTAASPTWGSEQSYIETTSVSIQNCWAPVAIDATAGGYWQPCFNDVTNGDVLINLTNDVQITAGAASSLVIPHRSYRNTLLRR